MIRGAQALIVALPVIVLGGCWTWVLSNRSTNELARLGVRIEWYYGGATSTVPGLKVWWEAGSNRVDAPDVFGGIENPELTFRDVSGDGVKDIVFGNEKHRQIMAFYPAAADAKPAFVVIEDTERRTR